MEIIRDKFHDKAKSGLNKPGHDADAYRENTNGFDPMDNKKANTTKKLALLKYKSIKPGMLILKPKKIIREFAEGVNIIMNESSTASKNEPVFEVIMAGNINPDYDLIVKPGDLIMLKTATGFKHLNHTKVLSNTNTEIPGFYTAESRDVVAIVEYTKLP